jgi:SAM-dependent methyltransferase
MNASLTGADYVAALDSRPSDRASRIAFQDLALSLAHPGARLFDFGCGPGIDARVYAEHGLEVGAYDVDPAMCGYFRKHCAPMIASGAIRLHSGSYEDFLRSEVLPGSADVALITANFAPLNLVGDLRPLFDRFASMLKPGGHVLVSVLNPLCVSDMKYAWWWRNVPRLAVRGEYSLPGAQAAIVRRMPGRIAIAAQGFALIGIHADHANGASPGSLATRLHFSPRSAAAFLSSRFLFLCLRLAERGA